MVSLAGNSAHAILTQNAVMPLWFTICWAAVPPLALPVTVHGAGVLAREQGKGWAYNSVVAAVALIAALAFVISFVALRDLTGAMGSPAFIAWLFPILVDATASVATVALLVLGEADAIQVESGDSRADAPESAGESPASLPEPATTTDLPAAPPLTHATRPITCDDSPASQLGDGTATRDIDVSRADEASLSQGDAPDPLLGLAMHLVESRRTTLSVEVTHSVLVMHADGASTRAIAAEVGTVSPATVGRIARAARELASVEEDHPELSLVG